MSMSNRTVLVVDDEAEQRDLIRGMLRPEAYTVLDASDFAEALAAQATHLGEIDLLLIDVSLPGGNGYDLYRDLLAIEPQLKVLFVSAPAGSELCRFFDMQVTDVHFLQKPFERAELLWHLKSVLELAGPLAGNASAD